LEAILIRLQCEASSSLKRMLVRPTVMIVVGTARVDYRIVRRYVIAICPEQLVIDDEHEVAEELVECRPIIATHPEERLSNLRPHLGHMTVSMQEGIVPNVWVLIPAERIVMHEGIAKHGDRAFRVID
jgi:hypothetical protein